MTKQTGKEGVVRIFRKKPAVVEAMEFTGENGHEIMLWAHEGVPPDANSIILLSPYNFTVQVRTLEGTMIAGKGDFIIKGVKGEFYPCKPDIFEATYEPVT